MLQPHLMTLAHGGGGARTDQLIHEIILRHLGNPILNELDDGAYLRLPSNDIVMTTDSYVVWPLFFPGGDIGKLSFCGTINDLVMQGSEPKYISVGLIIEEGFPVSDFEKIIVSMARVAEETDVRVVTGDTKVVERGKGNGLFINTTGIGIRIPNTCAAVSNAKPGDAIILTGSLAEHGISILQQRENLKFEGRIMSDVAPLWSFLKPLLYAFPREIHALRDPTRGGVAAALWDISRAAKCDIRVFEKMIPIKKEVLSACNLLGFDPLQIANEGKALIICDRNVAEAVLDLLRRDPLGQNASIIGFMGTDHSETVVLNTLLGGERIIEKPSGEDLPRIC